MKGAAGGGHPRKRGVHAWSYLYDHGRIDVNRKKGKGEIRRWACRRFQQGRAVASESSGRMSHEELNCC